MSLFNLSIKSTDPNAHTQAADYYRHRAAQYLPRGWDWPEGGLIERHEWGVVTYFTHRTSGERYASAYVFDDYTGQGIYSNWVKACGYPIVVGGECEAARDYFYAKKVWQHNGGAIVRASGNLMYTKDGGYKPGLTEVTNLDEAALLEVEETYGDKCARRSGIPYVYHIYEGLRILQDLGADYDTMAAWCLHPLVQADEALDAELNAANPFPEVPTRAIILAMEYRFRANSHLSKDEPKVPSYGHREELRLMLIADKVQNRKDFERVLRGRPDVPNSDRLDAYYKEWLTVLGVDEAEYARLTALILPSR